MTQSGIEPATLQPVAQLLNQLRQRVAPSDVTTCPVWWHHVSRPMTPHVPSDDTTCPVRCHHMSRPMTPHVPSDDTTCPVRCHHMSRPMTPRVPSDNTTCSSIRPRNNPDSAPSRPTSCFLGPSDEELEGRPALGLTLLCAALFSRTQLNALYSMWSPCVYLITTWATGSLFCISLTELQLKNIWCLQLPRHPLFSLQSHLISLGLKLVHSHSTATLYPHSHALKLKHRHFNDTKLRGNNYSSELKTSVPTQGTNFDTASINKVKITFKVICRYCLNFRNCVALIDMGSNRKQREAIGSNGKQ